mmetsp:Transcript_5737/g.14227  ORF Transcript_5737/g.14227 Transcript_5737/m.14227 type:complete len:288 (-) Transcript_5737:1557-2420(-)|eukprot:CAMPEP_0172393142 /NCGR_PEP_ID=MMETSP1061-20121228/9088_1 /TAXON_ID=37318 /ORGANISM="Pseudo-nitzschia pungens, Strain cf. pungens" /LENGTH=287 /DNA_ID=CAMNT_0013124141 /DNA_START=352 /DNA_END=1215 /DNA_ORIENTATION=+
MSFQDVGKRNASRRPVQAGMGRGNSRSFGSTGSGSSTTTSSAGNGNGITGSNFGSLTMSAASATSQISDSLTQYHRNVGILEKIAQSLLACQSGLQREELVQQYKTQNDVLRQLEAKLKEQILAQRERLANQSQTSSQKQALAKLERDFERVQSSVVALQSRVTRQRKQFQQRGAAAAAASASGDSSSSTHNKARTALEQQQMLVQQDRLQEEIMREREEEIRKINQGMHQVNQIYRDLAHIVGEQQEHVDQIEDKMEESKTAAQSGLEQIHKANESYGANANCAIM